MPGFRNADPRPDVIAHPFPATPRLNCRENVEPSFKPIAESLRDLHRFMHGVICGLNAIHHSLASIHREVRMKLHHGVARRVSVVSVDLDFVIVLSGGGKCTKNQKACKQDEGPLEPVISHLALIMHGEFRACKPPGTSAAQQLSNPSDTRVLERSFTWHSRQQAVVRSGQKSTSHR